MAAETTIAEFMVQLGFKIDEQKRKEMKDAMDEQQQHFSELGSSLLKFAGIASSAAVATGYAMNEMTKAYTDTYYAAQFIHTSVANLRDYAYAMNIIGFDTAEATKMLNGFVEATRENPGLAKYFETLTGAKFNFDDPVESFNKLLEALNKYPYAQQVQIFQMWHGTADELQRLRNNFGAYKDALREHHGMVAQAGTDLDDLANKSVAFQRSVTKINEEWGLISDGIEAKLLPVMQTLANWSDTIFKNFHGITAGIEDVGKTANWLLSKLTGGVIPEGDIKGTSQGGHAFPDGLGGKMGSVAPTPPPGVPTREHVISYIMMHGGYTHEQAAGLADNFQRESNFDTKAVGDSGHAVGIGQWHEDRQAAYKRMTFGKDLKDASLDEQIDFSLNELLTTFKDAGDKLRTSKTEDEANYNVMKRYERPQASLKMPWDYNSTLGPPSTTTNNQSVALTQNITNNVTTAADKDSAQWLIDRVNRGSKDALAATAGRLR